MECTNLTERSNLNQAISGNDRQPIRILHVVGGMNAGGIETWLMNVLRFIDRDLFQMDFLVHTSEPCFYDEEIRSFGSKIILCPNPSNPGIYSYDFKKILRDHGPYDIVHSQVYLYDGFVLKLAEMANIPVRISHIHPLTDINQTKSFRSIYRWIMCRSIAKHATHVLCPSQNTLDNFQKKCNIPDERADILYNGVDLNCFDRYPDRIATRKQFNIPIDRTMIVYVARFDRHKNHAQIFRIAQKINQDRDDIHFVLVGSNGEFLSSFQEQSEQYNTVSIVVGVQDISPLLCAADLFFFPSLEEGFGIVAIEAAAAGLPIVATDLPTIREACATSHHAFMFPANDDEIAIENILKIIDNKELSQNLSNDARKWAENFSIISSVNKLSLIYKKAIQLQHN